MTFAIHDAAALDATRHAALWALLAESYETDWRERWTAPVAHVVDWNDEGVARTHAGVVRRQGYCDDTSASIGGVAGVRTHEHYQHLGLATTAVGKAVVFLRDLDVDFVLLVCSPELCGFYERLGFHQFDGAFRCARSVPQEVMVLPFRKAPKKSIDLCGLPW